MIVDAAGGYSEWITVNTTGPWTATLNITPNDYKMTLIKENGNISQEYGNTIQGASGEKFRIYFPENTTYHLKPEAILNVRIDDTSVSKMIRIRQKSLETGTIYLDSWGNVNLGLGANNASSKFNYLSNNLRNPAMFGPTGKMPVSDIHFSGVGGGTPNIKKEAHIYQTGSGSSLASLSNPGSITKAHAEMIKEWMKEPNRVYFHMQKTGAGTSIRNLVEAGVLEGIYQVGELSSSGNYPVIFKNQDHPLMRFLLEEGPFTKDDPIRKIEIKEYRRYLNTVSYLSKWPDTFIPIILDTDGKCFFGIDPANRFVFMGDDDIIFDNYQTGIYLGEDKVTKQKNQIMNNAMAWMLNVAIYGEEFLKKFR